MKLVIGLTILISFLSACSSEIIAGGRAPNQFESAYHDFALKLEDPSLCLKIFDRAYSSAGFNPKGHRIFYEQSICLYDLALKTRNPYFCNDVASISTSTLDGSKISKENCIKEAEQGRQGAVSTSFNKTLVMTAMGYNEDLWSTELKRQFKEYLGYGYDRSTARDLTWSQFYLQEIYKNKNDFQKMTNKLPDFTE